ncbi:hypothetical protein MKW94_014811 [Papaver nudicaule]|uniref:Uncharacterized protein n=1 Tax=Papaver nudicaule TaxID=74823 RepID=A0AA41V2X9_PAPNU|nr:hypothetical protein [Papaver nudicaule]
MESEAPTRDFSRLSVSDNPPPPPRKLEPMEFSELNWGSITFTAWRNCTNSDDSFASKPRHKHVIKFYGNNFTDKFTVDGGPERDATDPYNIKFVEAKSYLADFGWWARYICRIKCIVYWHIPRNNVLLLEFTRIIVLVSFFVH